jgi:hypothetical protein
MMIKGKRRVVERQYFNSNTLYLMQIYERTVFKRWLNVGVTSDGAYAQQWREQQFLTEREYRKRLRHM